MKATLNVMMLLLAVGLGNAGSIVPSGPNGEEAVKLRGEFLAQAVPISYEPHVKQADQFHISWIELTGRTQAFAERHSATDLIYAFWPWFDNPQHAPEATVLLLGVTHREMMRPQRLSYVDRANPGNWARLASGYMDECKIACRLALNQPDWWYPHKVLFDRDTVLAETKSNGVVRASYIAAMQKALSDPKIQTENPLEVKNVLEILSALKAKEAAHTFVDYMFYDWRRGRDYRLQVGEAPRRDCSTNELARFEHGNIGSLIQSPLPCITFLPLLGDSCVASVIQRLADCSPEERSMFVGGGAAPACVIYYFIYCKYTEGQAIGAIEAFKRSHPELRTDQIAILDEVLDAIRTKKYRGDGLLKNPYPVVRGWAPSSTNVLSTR